MSNSRIPSPARSLGVISSPRRYKQRRSRSVCSPGRLETSLKLTAIISDTFVPSPLPKRRSVLNDDTEIIDMPKRKSWWRKLDENSQDVIELFEHKEVHETKNIEENFDVEILSQEKKNYTLDLPESSDGESISSIVIPQRKLFTQKENHPPKKFPRVFNNRDELVKLQKSHVDHDKEIDVRPKSLFNQGKKPKAKPIFPSALLNITANKSIANKTREIPTVEPKGQVRNLFGNRPGTKRKNMFADFVVSESEDEVPEIQAKVFGFQEKSEQKHRVSNARGVENSPTVSVLDIDMDDWKQLPSSTMMENQIEDLAGTPAKRKKLSKFIEPKETASPNKSFNKTKCNESLQSYKPKLTSSPQNNEEDMEMNASQFQKPNQSKAFNKTQTDAQSSKLGKTYDVDKNEGAKGVQNKTLIAKDSTVENIKINATKETGDHQKNQDHIQDGSDDENDFTLEYENDEDNLEQVENEKEKVNKNSLEEFQSKKQNESSMHNQSSQSEIPKDIDKSKNKSNTTLVKVTNMNISQNPKNGSNHDNSQITSVNYEIKKTKGSTIQNQSVETIVDKHDMSNKHVININKNKTYNSEDLVNKQSAENNSSNLVIQNDNGEESGAKKNKSIDEVNKISLNSKRSKTHYNEVGEVCITDDVDKDVQNEENEDSSDESIQLDESETHNESQESQNVEENGNNESHDEINEAENDTSDKVLSLNEIEIEPVLDEVDNIREKDNNLNKSDKNLERSKHSESKVDPPEAILFQQSKNLIESFTDRGKSPRKTKSMLKNNLALSLAPVRESTGFSDNTANSSGANSGWDSHRTTRKTLRKTFGKDFTPRKSLRTLVMEKSAKNRQTFNPDLQDISKHPRANSTELPGHGMNEPQEQFDDETVENIQHAIENNVYVKETPEGTEIDIVVDDHMKTEETNNANKSQEQSEAAESHTQSEERNDENAKSSDEEPNENSKVESDHENDATENQQTSEESDHENNDTENQQAEQESDQENDAIENQQSEEESEHENDAIQNRQSEEESEQENDAIENQQSEEGSDHENDAIGNQQSDDESDHENDAIGNQQSEDESDHANNTSNQQTDHESDHDLNEEETGNQDEEESDDDQEHSDNVTRDNQFAESGYNNDEISENNIQENNTEMGQTVEESNHYSRSMKQRTLEMYLEKINKQELERKKKLCENLMNSVKTYTHNFKVPAIPMRRNVKSAQKKVKAAPAKTMVVDDLPEEIKQDLKYKPPRRYQPKNASWATKRLYKYLEAKLEPKYDYMARVRAEKLVNTLHEFTRHIKRHETAPAHTVAALKQEMARLKIVDTHYDFYHFFNEFMPREIRVKVNPDIVNRIQLPKDVFSNIIR